MNNKKWAAGNSWFSDFLRRKKKKNERSETVESRWGTTKRRCWTWVHELKVNTFSDIQRKKNLRLGTTADQHKKRSKKKRFVTVTYARMMKRWLITCHRLIPAGQTWADYQLSDITGDPAASCWWLLCFFSFSARGGESCSEGGSFINSVEKHSKDASVRREKNKRAALLFEVLFPTLERKTDGSKSLSFSLISSRFFYKNSRWQ